MLEFNTPRGTQRFPEIMRGLVLGAFMLVLGARPALAQITAPTSSPGINFFSRQQDIELGAESALEAEKQLVLVQDARLTQYIRSIAQRIVAASVSNPSRFQFHIVNSNNVDSLAFPNGAIYIYQGLLTITANDAEVAAVIAHEVSHVVLRHATSQLSRQLLVQAPVSLSAGLPMSEGWKDQLNKLGVVFGVNAPFLHYSPEQEAEAAEMTAKLLRSAGYNNEAYDQLLRKLIETRQKPDAPILSFLYNHPLAERAIDSESDSESIALPKTSMGASGF
jgi:predicted Zn-dependent protease